MSKNSYKVSRKRKHGSVWPVLLLLLAAVILALLVSGMWQVAEGKPFFPPSGDMLPPPQQAPKPESGDEADASRSSSSSSALESSEPESQPEEAPELPVFDGAVPESASVDQSYFDDAVFVGDSITEGMLYYDGMSNATILAGTGINFSTVSTAPVVKNLEDGTALPILEALAKTQYPKVYVMLGGNEVRDMSREAFLERYEKVLDKIREIQPDAIIYVQSMTPVTENNNYSMSNSRIDEFNEAILEMCKRKGLYFLNVAECMKDSRGMLPTEASPKDGMHFGQEYFNKWFAYLKTHTVDGQPSAVPSQASEDAVASIDETDTES